MTPKDILYRAAEIKRQTKLLQAEYEMIQEQLKTAILDSSLDKDKPSVEVGNLGTFYLSPYRNYSYSAEVNSLQEKLKEKKKTEEADGTAECQETQIVKFMELKS